MAPILLDANMTEAALGKAIGRGLRSGDPIALEVRGDTDLGLGASGWITTLARARSPVAVALIGNIGERGLALALLADTVTMDKTTAKSGAHRSPVLATLVTKRFGLDVARRYLTEDDPLAALAACGMTAGVAIPGITTLKPSLIAALELPFDEAVAFAELAATQRAPLT